MKPVFFLIFAALLSTSARAEDCINCGPEISHGSTLEKQVSNLSRISQVDCRQILTSDVDEEYARHFSREPQKSSVVLGVKLQGSADELKFLNLMLDKKPMDEWSRAKGCSTVLCALGKVYQSETTAKRVLNIAKRNGYIVSARKDFTNEADKPIGQLFSSQEIETIDLAYKRLPANFNKLKTLDRLKRMPDGYKSPRSPNAAAYASPGFKSSYYSDEGEIVFISSSFDQDNTWASSVAVHELSHHLDFSKPGKDYAGYSETDEFLKLSGWKMEKSYTTDKSGKKVLKEKWTRPENKKFVRDYAGTEPAEDFAEAVAYYIYEPNLLRQTDPAKYNFIKNKVFAGKEYDKTLENMISKDDLIKSCFANAKAIELRGYGKIFKENYFSNCLGDSLKNLTPATPEQCALHADIIKTAAHDQINADLAQMNEDIGQCDQNLKKHRSGCISEGDFRKTCALTRCNLKPEIHGRIKDATYYAGESKEINEAIVKKLGKANIIMAALAGGLKEKGKIHPSFSLNHQKNFISYASAEVKAQLDKAGIQYDDGKSIESNLQYELMTNDTYTKAFGSFHQKVLIHATKSKEKNLALIKEWAARESLEESQLPEQNMDDLAEKLLQHGKGSSLFSRD